MHQGVRRDGARLYPAMPYASYTYMTDADALAIKAYLFSLPPVHAPARPNTLAFPFNQRWLMALWSPAVQPGQALRAASDRSLAWNRGAYLAEALAHCGDCHTPRNLAQRLDNRRKFGGAAHRRLARLQHQQRQGLPASAPGATTGFRLPVQGHATGHGTATGPMGEAVDNSFSQMTPSRRPRPGDLPAQRPAGLDRPTCLPP